MAIVWGAAGAWELSTNAAVYIGVGGMALMALIDWLTSGSIDCSTSENEHEEVCLQALRIQ